MPQGHCFAGLMVHLFLGRILLGSLKEVLQYCNLDEDRYKTHSFRIGAASWAAAKGMSDSQIRAFGRWNSNAFLKYIRMPTLGTDSLLCKHSLSIMPNGLASYSNRLTYMSAFTG